MKTILLFSLFAIFSHTICAQGLKVKSFTTNTMDLSASTQQRTDANGRPCGLVKVLTKVSGMEFGENVVGLVENKTNEYWVYLPEGTTEFVIIRPDYLPMTVRLEEFGIKSIETKTTYSMVLKETNLNPEKCALSFHVKPREAEVIIDNVVLKNNPSGDYKVLLPKGEHLCNFRALGYRSDMKIIKTGKVSQDINVELESLMADVNILSKTSTAQILVNGESVGVGGWKGKVLPGAYVIEVQQEGYVTYKNNITLAEKERRTITIPELARIKGTLNIQTTPEGCTVLFDGTKVGTSPCVIKDVVFGNHTLKIELDAYGLHREKDYQIRIEKNEEQKITCELATNADREKHQQALEWFKNGMYNNIIENIDGLDQSFFTQRVRKTAGIDRFNGPMPLFCGLICYYTYDYDYCSAWGFEEFIVESSTRDRSYETIPHPYLDPDVFNTKKKQLDPHKAIKVANKVGLDTISGTEIFMIASSLYLKGFYEEALDWYKKGLQRTKKSEEYWCSRVYEDEGEDLNWYVERQYVLIATGNCCAILRNNKDAIQYYQQALEILDINGNENVAKKVKTKIQRFQVNDNR